MSNASPMLDRVKELYPDFPDKEIAEMLEISEKYVRNVGGRYGLKKTYHWTEREKHIVLRYYQKEGVQTVIEKLRHKGFSERTTWTVINLYRELTGKKESTRKL